MEIQELLKGNNALSGILIGILLHVVVQGAKFGWELWKAKERKKEKLLETNTEAIRKLTTSIEELKEYVVMIKKHDKDLNRYFNGMRILAGKDWPSVRAEIMQDSEVNQ